MDIEKHRLWIATRANSLLDPYWDKRPNGPEVAMITGDWIHHLSKFTPAEITAACREYQIGKQRRRKPGPGDIVEIAEMARPHWQDVARKGDQG